MEDKFDPAGGVYVTVAGNHSLGISKDDRLVYFPNNPGCSSEVKDLGPATRQNIESLRIALKRLEVHTIEN